MLLWQVLAGEKEWTRSTEFRCKDLTYTVAGLMEGADYYIRVVAVNDAGPGAPGVTEPVMVKEPQGYYTQHCESPAASSSRGFCVSPPPTGLTADVFQKLLQWNLMPPSRKVSSSGQESL